MTERAHDAPDAPDSGDSDDSSGSPDAPDAPDAIATYVFAVCRTLDPATVAGLSGVADEAPVRGLRFGTLTAVVQSVPAADFTDEAWRTRLADRDALERCARAHHDAVSAAAACGPTVPLPLATLYLGDERAETALKAEADRFHTVLRRIAHHAEWGVKVYAPGPPADAPTARPAPPADRGRPAPGAGLAYLDRKRGIQQQRERRHEESLRIAEAVDAELRSVCAASRRLRPHGQELSGEPHPQVLNAAYLVDEERARELVVLARALSRRTGARIDVTGPWVPYSFVGEE